MAGFEIINKETDEPITNERFREIYFSLKNCNDYINRNGDISLDNLYLDRNGKLCELVWDYEDTAVDSLELTEDDPIYLRIK